jgi:hypothetical protein
MKKIMSLAVILMMVLGSCGNLGKSEETRLRELNEKIDAQINLEKEPERLKEQAKEKELIKIFRDAENGRCPSYEFIKIAAIKKGLIKQYGEECYNKLIELSQEEFPMEYFVISKDDHSDVDYERSNYDSYAKIYYDESWHGLFLTLVINGIGINHDGTYEKGSWETRYYKNDFDENDLNEPYIYLGDNRTGKSSLDIKIDKHCIYLFPNNSESTFGYSGGIDKITIRNEDTGEIYDIPFESVSQNLNNYAIITDVNSIGEFIGLLNNNNITISIVCDNFKCVVKMDHEHCKNVYGAILTHIRKEKFY